MTDVVEKAFNAFTNALASQPSGVSDYDSAMGAALATLTTGSTWTTDDGVEVMLVPVEATAEMVRRAHIRDPLGCDVLHAGEIYPAIYDAMLSAIRK